MSLFSSPRERRLWLWTAAVLLAIYLTLGLAGTMAGFLREHRLLRIAVALSGLLAAGVAAWLWARRRPGRSELGVALVVAVVYSVAWVRIQTPEERTHLIEYGVVAVLVHQALRERRRRGRRVPAPALLAVAAAAALGWLDEAIQGVLPNRVYDVRDVGFNLFAAALAIAASAALAATRRWVRRRQRRPPPPDER